jgi:hypothetical protein
MRNAVAIANNDVVTIVWSFGMECLSFAGTNRHKGVIGNKEKTASTSQGAVPICG